MQEDVHAEADAVLLPAGLKAGANRRLAGEDVRKGAVVLPAGRVPRRRFTTPTALCSTACSNDLAPR
jgi:molybdopterin biosynthesis enzyme